MRLDLPFVQVSRVVAQTVQTTFSFPNPLSESEELVLWMFKDSAIILDAIRWSLFNKSAKAAMFTSVRVDVGPLSSSSTNYHPSRNRVYHLKTLDRFRASFP